MPKYTKATPHTHLDEIQDMPKRHYKNIVKVGKIFPTTNCGNVIIVNIENYDHIKIKFLNTGTTRIVRYPHLLKGTLRDRNALSIAGQGALGDVPVGMITEDTPPYNNTRIYNLYYHLMNKANKAGLIVSEEFKTLEQFIALLPSISGYEDWMVDVDTPNHSPDKLVLTYLEFDTFTDIVSMDTVSFLSKAQVGKLAIVRRDGRKRGVHVCQRQSS